jgi:hypothetical protein
MACRGARHAAQLIVGHRISVPVNRALRVDRQADRRRGRFGRRRRIVRQVELDRVGKQRCGDDEDHQQYQHDVDQRSDVDLSHWLQFAGPLECAEAHRASAGRRDPIVR